MIILRLNSVELWRPVLCLLELIRPLSFVFVLCADLLIMFPKQRSLCMGFWRFVLEAGWSVGGLCSRSAAGPRSC